MEDNKQRAKRQYKTVSVTVLNETAERLGLSPAAVCDALGYSASSAADFKARGVMPAVAALACEALVRRQGANASMGDMLVITSINGGMVQDSRVVLKPGRAVIAGQEFLLVPVKGVGK